MKSKELRIGNWVYNETTREYMEVYPMMIPQINRLDGTSHNIRPIPLTEEILLKCGFEKYRNKENFYYLQINDWVKIDAHTYNGNVVIELSVSNHGYCPPCDNIHQLQNLYFALTGQELEIKF